jgi:hypothetical protein
MPDEPLTTFGEGVVQMHEMFLALIAGGFTEDQAIRFLVQWVKVNGESDA